MRFLRVFRHATTTTTTITIAPSSRARTHGEQSASSQSHAKPISATPHRSAFFFYLLRGGRRGSPPPRSLCSADFNGNPRPSPFSFSFLVAHGRSLMVGWKMRRRKRKRRRREVFEVRKSGSPVRDPAAWMGFMSFPRQRPSARAAPSSTPAAGDMHIRHTFRNKSHSSYTKDIRTLSHLRCFKPDVLNQTFKGQIVKLINIHFRLYLKFYFLL